MAAKKKPAAKKTKKAAKKVIVKKPAPAKRKPAPKKAAKKVVKKAAKKKSAKAKVTPARLRAAAPKITPFDDRIAMARDNLRQLVEQAASSAGAANEELLAQRISTYEERVRDLVRQRDDYIKKTR